MRSDYVDKETLGHVLAALMPANRLAIEISLATGLRIGDVLQLRTEQLKEMPLCIMEQKTGKKRKCRLPESLLQQARQDAGTFWVFTGRGGKQPRTRQAVYADLKRAAKLFRVKVQLSPHSARKVWAVNEYRRSNLQRVQRLLNHKYESVTMLYALADQIQNARRSSAAPRAKPKASPLSAARGTKRGPRSGPSKKR